MFVVLLLLFGGCRDGNRATMSAEEARDRIQTHLTAVFTARGLVMEPGYPESKLAGARTASTVASGSGTARRDMSSPAGSILKGLSRYVARLSTSGHDRSPSPGVGRISCRMRHCATG